MATLTVCDNDGNDAQFRVSVASFTGSTVTEFDCCSAACAGALISARLETSAEPEA